MPKRLLTAAALGALSASGPAQAQLIDSMQARQFRSSTGKTLAYRLFVPAGYVPTRRYPSMLTLHGAGERGNDNRAQLSKEFSLLWARPQHQQKYPSFLIAPQCPLNNGWVDTPWGAGSYNLDNVPLSDDLRAVVELLDSLGREFSLDPARQYVSGLSMGGYGAWDLALRFPGRFAAALPVCGAGDPRKAASIASLPIWAFHGAADKVVPPSGSRDMVNALRSAGGSPRYTEYPGVEHESWIQAAQEPELVDWVFAQSRPVAIAMPRRREPRVWSGAEFLANGRMARGGEKNPGSLRLPGSRENR